MACTPTPVGGCIQDLRGKDVVCAAQRARKNTRLRRSTTPPIVMGAVVGWRRRESCPESRDCVNALLRSVDAKRLVCCSRWFSEQKQERQLALAPSIVVGCPGARASSSRTQGVDSRKGVGREDAAVLILDEATACSRRGPLLISRYSQRGTSWTTRSARASAGRRWCSLRP